jgi:hypothetical protein
MGAGFLQDLVNQGATQNATQAPNYTMPTYQGGGVATTQGQNFNQTTNLAPYWGTYTAPVNINPSNTRPTMTYGGQPQLQLDGFGRPVSQSSYMNGGGNYTNKNRSTDSNQSSFDNPSSLPNYSMYIAPEHMPDINAYLQNPNSLLGALQSSGVPSAGAGRYSNLLSTNTSKGK